MAHINNAREQAKVDSAAVSVTPVFSTATSSEHSSGNLEPQYIPSDAGSSEERRETLTTSPSTDSFERASTIADVSAAPTSASVPSTFSKKYLYQWKWELAACALVLATAAAMVATMYPHGNQPIPKWPFKITINALLSIYSLVFKAAIGFVVTSCVGQLQWAWFSPSNVRPLSDVALYNDAGHSLWGSLALLWTQRLRQPLIILAAVIMLGNVIIDPFIQQFIQPFDCSIPLNGETAILPRTNVIDEQFGPGVNGRVPPEVFWSALSEGVTSKSSATEIPWSCSTGNCTFTENYDTLGICSKCEDISAEIVITTTTTTTPYDDGTPCETRWITSHISSGDNGYYWSANSDRLSTNFSDRCGLMSHHTDIASMDIWAPMPSDNFMLRVDTLVGKTEYSDARRLISTGQNITGCESPGSNDTWACRGYGAVTCTLRPCIRTYSASIESGNLKERLVSQSEDVKWGSIWGPNYYGLLDKQCLSAEEKSFLIAHGYEIDDNGRWTPYEGDLSSDNPGFTFRYPDGWLNNLKSLLDHKCVYLVDLGFVNKIGYGTWAGPFIRNPAGSNLVGAVRGIQRNFHSNGQTVLDTFSGPQLLQKLYNYGEVDFERIQDTFQNISESLTTFIRTHGNQSYSEPAMGQVQHYAICLGVQWPWITVPAILAALTILFLVLVMESTRRLRMPVWKVSLLPWILGGALEGNSFDSGVLVDEISDSASMSTGTHTYVSMSILEERSRSIRVNLSRRRVRNIAMFDLQDHRPQSAHSTQQR